MKTAKQIFSYAIKFFILIGIGFSLGFLQANAAQIIGVKGKKVLISVEGEDIRRGQVYYVVNPNRKRSGILKILKVKGDKAIAVLGKGKARKGWSIKLRKKKSRKKPTMTAKKKAPSFKGGSSSSSSNAYWGIIAGFALNTMDVDLENPDQTVNLTGSGISAKALVDYGIFESVWFRGMIGLENFATSGDEVCGAGSNETCEVNISYLTLDLWGRYLFSKGSFRPWVGGGFDLLFPMSNDTTALDDSSITNTSIMAAGLGFDWMISPTTYVPFHVEYGIFPSSDQVAASSIAIRLGVAFAF